MKKLHVILASFFVLLLVFSSNDLVASASSSVAVREVVDNTILLEDGTIWHKKWSTSGQYTKVKADIVKLGYVRAYSGNGVNAKGELVYWEDDEVTTAKDNHSEIKSISSEYYLNKAGKVWSFKSGYLNDMTDVVAVSYSKAYAFANSKGQILDKIDKFVWAQIEEGTSVIAIANYEDNEKIAYIDNKNRVYVLDVYGFLNNADKSMVRVPELLTEDAVAISFTGSGAIVVTKKDGTVWLSSPREGSKPLVIVKQLKAINNAVEASVYSGTLTEDLAVSSRPAGIDQPADSGKWLVKHKDGSWSIYVGNDEYPVVAPTINDLALSASSNKLASGSSVNLKATQIYSNGYQEQLTDPDLKIDKPYLLKKQKDGSYKASGVGEVKVTYSDYGTEQSVLLTVNANKELSGAISKDSTTYLPVVSVFKALGASVSVNGSNIDISLGSTKLQLKTGSKKATLNGKEITLNNPVQVLNGSTVFPAALLNKASIAKVSWDNNYKKMTVTVGKGSLVIVSSDTAKIIKKEMQGNLVNYINKTYWVNGYSDWKRFIKLTVADIVPNKNNFDIVFKGPGGREYKINNLDRTYVSTVLNNTDLFLTYDPYKKYNWSSTIWSKIENRKISTGMNKEQVLLSWGEPSSTSYATSNNIRVEVWRYGKQYVSFVNGAVKTVHYI